jgi:hypothetical protein
VADRPVAGGRRLTGERDDLDDLLGGEGRPRAGPRGVGQGIRDALDKRRVVVTGRLGGGQRPGGGVPARTPALDGPTVKAQLVGDLVGGVACGGGQHDPDTTDEALGAGVPTGEPLQQGPLALSQLNRRCFRATHRTLLRWDKPTDQCPR